MADDNYDDILIAIVNDNHRRKKMEEMRARAQALEEEQEKLKQEEAEYAQRTRSRKPTLKNAESKVKVSKSDAPSLPKKLFGGAVIGVLTAALIASSIAATKDNNTPTTPPTDPPGVVDVVDKEESGSIVIINQGDGTITGTFVVNGAKPADDETQDADETQGAQDETAQVQPSEHQRINVTHTREELSNYLDYAYVSNYGSKQYYYCPDSYLLEISQYAINNVNDIYAKYLQSKGKEVPEDGYALPRFITPEFIAAIAKRESSGTIIGVNGEERVSSAGAVGLFQHTAQYDEEVSKFATRRGGQEYTRADNNNPVTAAESTIWGLTRLYVIYLNPESSSFVGYDFADNAEIAAAALSGYNAGEGNLIYYVNSGAFPNMYYNRTNAVGEYASDIMAIQQDFESKVDVNTYNNTLGFDATPEQ